MRQDPKIEDIIRLLNLYDIPEVQSLDKKKSFEALLEEQGKEASFEEQKDVGDYFHSQLEDANRIAEMTDLQKKVNIWRVIVQKRIEESLSIEEVTQAAEWYHRGRGMFDQNSDRARELYKTLFPVVDSNEKRRIKHCLESLDKLQAVRGRPGLVMVHN